MKKVLVLGSTGMLGHVLYNYLDDFSKYNLFNVSFRKKLNSKTTIIDVSDFEKLKDNRFILLTPTPSLLPTFCILAL